MSTRTLGVAILVCAMAVSAMGQVRVIPVQPVQPAQTAQPRPEAVEPLVTIRAVRQSCGDNLFARLRFVTSLGDYEALYSCFPFTCAADTKSCRTGCSNDTQCAPGAVCAEGRCVIPTPRCSADGLQSVSPLGTDNCFPYVCTKSTGVCMRDCRSSEDCANGLTCDNRVCVKEAPRTDE